MKVRLLRTLLVAVLLVSASGLAQGRSAPAKELPPMKGLHWLEASITQRMEQVVASVYLLSSRGMVLTKTPEDYYQALSEKLRRRPDLYSDNVSDILSDIVRESEPQTKPTVSPR